MEDFLKRVEPIIKTQIKLFSTVANHPAYGYKDLLHEGYIAAVEALRKWEMSDKNDKASVLHWVKCQVTDRFLTIYSELKGTVYLDDLNSEPASDDALSDDAGIDQNPLLNGLTKDKRLVVRLIGSGLSQKAISKIVGKTKARITQIRQESALTLANMAGQQNSKPGLDTPDFQNLAM